MQKGDACSFIQEGNVLETKNYFSAYLPFCLFLAEKILFYLIFFKSTNRFRISNIIVELIPLSNTGWKKEFWKYSCLTLNKGMLLWFLGVRVDKTLGIISKR